MVFPQEYPKSGSRNIVGGALERRACIDLGLDIRDRDGSHLMPDLSSQDSSFRIEVKGSAQINGAVIREKQLKRFNEGIFLNPGEIPLVYDTPIFYAFLYHRINNHLENRFPIRRNLQRAIHRNFISAYIFPIEIISELYLQLNPILDDTKKDSFVQVQESKARAVYTGDRFWEYFENIKYDDYTQTQLGKYHFLTRKNQPFPFDLSNLSH